jgi:hypothetical protein
MCDMVRVFLGDQYADFVDYTSAVRQVWGDPSADRMHEAVKQVATQRVWTSIELAQQEEAADEVKLLYMPEPDFRLAVILTVRTYGPDPSTRITAICKRRGIPWEFSAQHGFRWTGDEQVEGLALRPAQTLRRARRRRARP